MGRVVRWSRKARVNYVHCRTGKGNLQAWRHILDEDTPDQCRKCGRYAATGKHVALVCIHGEDIGRRWGTWEQMDEPERWSTDTHFYLSGFLVREAGRLSSMLFRV